MDYWLYGVWSFCCTCRRCSIVSVSHHIVGSLAPWQCSVGLVELMNQVIFDYVGKDHQLLPPSRSTTTNKSWYNTCSTATNHSLFEAMRSTCFRKISYRNIGKIHAPSNNIYSTLIIRRICIRNTLMIFY